MDLRNGTVAADKVRDVIKQAEENYHVIGALSFGDIPEGHSVTLNVIKANPDSKAGDVYDVGMGKFGLSGNFLSALADMAGVSVAGSQLLAYQTNYCVAEVTIARMGLDGRVRRQTSRKIMDLRPGSGQRKAMEAAAKEKGKDAAAQIREQQLRLPEHADSKARLRAIRALLSIRTYTSAELQKPFAVFTLQFTGRTNDPQLKVLFATGLMQASLGSMGALYGGFPQQAPMPALAMGGGAPVGLLGAGGGAPISDVGDGIPDEEEGPQGDGTPREPPKVTAGDSKKVFLPGRKGEVPSIWDAPDEMLVEAEKRLRKGFLAKTWKEQFYDLSMRQLLTIRKEIRERGGPVDLCPELGDDPAPPTPRGGASAPARGQGAPAAKPPSDRGGKPDTRTDDEKLADAAFGKGEPGADDDR